MVEDMTAETREEITALVKESADIVQIISECVDLKRSGVRYLGLCPFHGEKTPSFSVHSGQQFFHCFGCGESGDVFSFMMKYYNLDFQGALKELARRYQIDLPEKPVSPEEQRKKQLRQLIYRVNEKGTEIYSRYLSNAPEAAPARAYLQKRAISTEIQEKFGIGYAPSVDTVGWDFLGRQLGREEREAAVEAGLLVKKEGGGVYDRFRDRILFPIFESDGRIAGFGGRIVGEGQPKYMNSPESPVFNKSRLLLGLYQQQEAIRQRRRVVLVEGNFDMISLVANGCDNVVAPLGTALTKAQIRILKHLADTVILLFDGDAAGMKAAIRSVPLFLAEQMEGRVALLPSGHDPDTFIREKGLGELNALLDRSEPLAEFIFTQLVSEHGLTLTGKSRIIDELRPLVKAAESPLQRSVVISHFGEKLGISSEQLAVSLAGEREMNPSVASPVVPKKTSPLTPAQKRLAGFLVMYPLALPRLEEAGIREYLTGGIGEILFLQIRFLLERGGDVQPEDLLTVLPDGVERDFVTEMLLKAPSLNHHNPDGDGLECEIAELMDWLRLEQLKGLSDQLLRKINTIQHDCDPAALEVLLQRKQKVDRELRGIID
jgi:DNA primase